MKTVLKILTALAAIAGILYVIATYGDKIVAWAKKILASCPCCSGNCDCDCDCECEGEGECKCGGECKCAAEAAEEEAAEEEAAPAEAPVEEIVIEENEPVAAEEDFAE